MTSKPRIFLTRRLPPVCMQSLETETLLTVNPDDRPLTKSEIIDGVRDVDGLLCLLTDTIDAEVMDANPDLKVIANYAVGYNNIDVGAATQRKIPVTNTPGVLTESTADMAFALLMAAGRRVSEGDRLVRTKSWSGWAPLQLLGTDITGATLGLVGLGRIGKAMIPRAKGFNMQVVYWNRTRLSEQEEIDLGIAYLPMEEVLRQSDFVSLHVSLADNTHHLIGNEQLAMMKPTASIINTARGPVIDEQALVAALQNGTIAAAGLDVYENEPVLESALYELENAVIAPHLGSATRGTRTKMGEMAIASCLAACRGERPPNLVNEELYD